MKFIYLKYLFAFVFLVFGTGVILISNFLLLNPNHYLAENLWVLNSLFFLLLLLKCILIFALARKQQKRMSRQSRQYRKLFYENPTPMWVFDKETYAFLAVNKAAEVQYGYSEAEFKSMTILDIRPPEDIERVKRCVKEASLDYYSSGLWKHYRKDGSLIYVRLASHSIYFNKRPAEIILATDNTQQVQYEKERSKLIQDLLQQNNRLEEYAYVISHQLRAPIANILGLAALFKEEEQETNRQVISMMKTSAERLDATLRDVAKLLDVNHQGLEQKTQVPFEEVLLQVKKMLEEQIEVAGATLEWDFHALPTIKSIPAYVRDTLHTLLLNSLKFRNPEAPSLIRIQSFRKDGKAYLSIHDNGLGLDLIRFGKQLGKPFSRFHHHTHGRGIGLSLLKRQLQILGGNIHFESTPGKGMLVEVSFPLE